MPVASICSRTWRIDEYESRPFGAATPMDPVSGSSHSAHACYQRGQLLRAQHRYDDAARMFQQALSIDPNYAPSYAMLALCWMRDEAKATLAVDAARRAVALEPEDDFIHGILALAVAGSAKDGQDAVLQNALKIARQAVQLNASSDFAHVIEAQILLRLRQFPQAEAAARRSLSLNIDNTMAAEALSAALLMQHKDEDNAELIRHQLEQNPEDDSSHTSAGWQALSKADHRTANKHFMEALRLNPENERARLGLVESFRARSWVYGGYLRFSHAMNRFSEGAQMGIMIGGFIAYRALHGALKDVSPFWSSLVLGLWLTLALWSHLARGFGSFFMVFDRFARRALKPMERWEGVAVGGGTLLAVLFLGLGLTVYKGGMLAALAFFFSAITSSAAFTNQHHVGKYVYGAAAVVAGVGALITGAQLLLPFNMPLASYAFSTAVIIGVAVSWFRPFRLLYA